jgi:hypothetical protein
MNLDPFLKAISFVNDPLVLIALIVVVLLGALVVVLNSTKGLEKAQELLFIHLERGEFIKLFKFVIFALVAIAAMLFVLLGYKYSTNVLPPPPPGLACYGASCTGRPPTYAGCDKGLEKVTWATGHFPDLGKDLQGKDLQNFDVEMIYSSRCKASWIKTPPVEKATIYFEDKAGKRYAELLIDPRIKEPQVTEMFFRNIESRGCIEYPGKKPQCTPFVAGHS